ncbi:hypothetical protein C8R42DRAFT_655889, partial [Lentinula raphanica]
RLGLGESQLTWYSIRKNISRPRLPRIAWRHPQNPRQFKDFEIISSQPSVFRPT